MTTRTLDIDFDDDGPDERVDVPLPYRTTDGTRHVETLTAYVDPGIGTVTAWVATGDKEQLATHIGYRLFVDDDGLPLDYRPPVKAGQVDKDHEDYDSRFEDREQWSSLRRYGSLITDSVRRVNASNLVKVVDAVIGEATGGRPTGRSARSSRGPQRTGAGSTGPRTGKRASR